MIRSFWVVNLHKRNLYNGPKRRFLSSDFYDSIELSIPVNGRCSFCEDSSCKC